MTLERFREILETNYGPPGPGPDFPMYDLDVFNLVRKLVPVQGPIIGHAAHDVIYLTVDPEALAAVITEKQAAHLELCGVGYDLQTGSLFKFV